MTEMTDYKEKVKSDVNEDAIIKKIMLEHPDLYSMLEFNEFTIKEKLEMNAYWYQNFRLLTIGEKRKLNQIKMIHDKYVGDLYHKLRFENDISINKIETEKYYIPRDPKVIEFKRLMMKQTIRVETYEAITDAFKTQGFTMNTFVKSMDM